MTSLTLGAYYFNNDLQNITIIPSFRILKNTLSLSGNAGIQRNNLDNLRASTTKRFVGAINSNYLPNEKWNIMLSYSNFFSYTNQKPLIDPNFQNNLDTLNFYQVSETMTGSVVRLLGKKERSQTLIMNISYQKTENEAGYDGGDQGSSFISTNISYSYSAVPSNLILAISTNIYITDASGIKSTFYGPTVSVTKSLLEKTLRVSFASSFNKTTGNNVSTGGVLNNRLNFTYSPPDKERSNSKSNFSLGINLLRRLQGTEAQPAFTEFTGTLNYAFIF